MEIPLIPTDRLFKTLAIGGLFMAFFSAYLIWVVIDNDDRFQKNHFNEYGEFIQQRFICKPQLERFKFDFYLKKEFLHDKFNVDYDSIKKDSVVIKNILSNHRYKNNLDSFYNELINTNYLSYKIDSIKARINYLNNLIGTESQIRDLFSSDIMVQLILAIFVVVGLGSSFYGFNFWFSREKLKK